MKQTCKLKNLLRVPISPCTSYIYLESTKRRQPSDRSRILQCDTCGRQFLSRENLENHIRQHVLTRNFCCKTCGKRYTTSRGLIYTKNLLTASRKPFLFKKEAAQRQVIPYSLNWDREIFNVCERNQRYMSPVAPIVPRIPKIIPPSNYEIMNNWLEFPLGELKLFLDVLFMNDLLELEPFFYFFSSSSWKIPMTTLWRRTAYILSAKQVIKFPNCERHYSKTRWLASTWSISITNRLRV